MANIYTSSPLGLLLNTIPDYVTTTGSWDGRTNFSAFNGKKLQRINPSSIHPSENKFQITPILSPTPHSNQIYDISTQNIIDNLAGIEHMRLTYSDFAYLKNFGVYPNNRLFIARRYPTPVKDDLYSLPSNKVNPPQSTIIGYLPTEEEDFIKLKFNEEWEQAEVSFTNLLNDLGKDFGFNLGGGAGSILEGAVNVIPLPGATLLLQRRIMKALGFISSEDDSTIPQGDPNLIKESMNRTLIGENDKGAGVKCQVSITLKTKYEQKFIDGVDPSYVFMDILNNCLQMGTSPATFYLGKQRDAANKVEKYFDDFMKDPIGEIKKFITALIDASVDLIDKIASGLSGNSSGEDKGSLDILGTLNSTFFGNVPQYVQNFIKAKYKVKFIGIINALTGGPSTPWHITIGNPLRPIFCSGDMLCESVSVNFGPQLSFNDLPTFIEVEVELKSARNLGLQEIFAKFNTGGIRVLEGPDQGKYTAAESLNYWNTDDYSPNKDLSSGTASITTSQEAGQTDQTPDATNRTGTQSTTLQTKVVVPSITLTPLQITPTNTDLQINSDPFSDSPVIPSGTDTNSQSLRTDATQETTGATDGFTDQKQSPNEVSNQGQDSQTIGQNNTQPNVVTVSEQVVISSVQRFRNGQIENLYQVNGVYQINGKQINGSGESFSNSEQIGTNAAKANAKQDAIKKSK
jgi:hypothetical protein